MAISVPAAGKMLGRYQILKPLAKGGMAEVFLARTIGLKGFERHIVLKFIRVEHGSNQKTIEMLLDEARLVASLHHRNIVQVHDVGQEHIDGGQYFFAMEYVHGEDTRTLLRKVKDRKEQIPFAHILTIITAAAAGLHYAHEQRGPDRKPLGIVHRDISPGNILIGFDGGVKVVDFGIAKTDQQSEDTSAGEMKGKVGYMSPEQCKALPLDRRTDVYMLGIVLYELCTVRRLFKGENRFDTMAQIVEGNIAPPSRYRKDLPHEFEQIIMKALATDPSERYQTADDLRLVLEAFALRSLFQISPSKLSDYMKELFGDKPEPWLDLPMPEAPVLSAEDLAAIDAQPISEPSMPRPRGSQPSIAQSTDDADASSAIAKLEVTEPVSGDTPMAWPVDGGSLRRGRGMLFAGIGAAVLALAAVAFFMFGGSSDKPTSASTGGGSATNVVTPAPADAGTTVVQTPQDAAATAVNASTVDADVVDDDIVITTPDGGVPIVARPVGGRPVGGRPTGGRPGGGRPAGDGGGKGNAAVIKTDKPPNPDLDSPLPD